MSTIGFITMAYGADKYFRQAETLARSIKRNMPGYKLALVTDRASVSADFDIVVPMERFDEAGTVHKVDMYAYSPFEETLFIDSDCVVIRPFEAELAAIRRYDFSPIVGRYLRDGEQDLWLEDVGRAVRGVGGRSFPKFNGGVYFFRKGPAAEEIFRRSGELRARATELGIKDFDRSGPGEETLIGLALSSLGLEDLYFDHGRLMRTPLNARGPIVADPIAGVCHFEKEGERVEPAIIHYCGDWIRHPTYLIAERALAKGKALSGIEKLSIAAPYHWSRYAPKVTRRLRRMAGLSA
jgi:hypothetical protein